MGLTNSSEFQIVYKEQTLIVTERKVGTQRIFHVKFPYGLKILLTVGTNNEGEKFWTSEPTNRLAEAKEIGPIIAHYFRKLKLTRTKNEDSLLIPEDVSLFTEELLRDNNYLLSTTEGRVNSTNCPWCKTGKLVIRQNSSHNNKFLRCSNYPICDRNFYNYFWILKHKFPCSDCKSGFMTLIKRNDGRFLLCTCYPKCKNIIKLI